MVGDIINPKNDGIEGMMSLALELQASLYKISRVAELGDPSGFEFLKSESEVGLKLIDTYLLCQKIRNNQMSLKLEPVGAGSLLHEVAYDIRKITGADVDISAKANEPVMANYEFLKNLIFVLGYFISSIEGTKKLTFASRKSKEGYINLSVTSNNFGLSNVDLRKLADDQSYIAFPKFSKNSPFTMMIANLSAGVLGQSLKVKKLSGKKGFSIDIEKSHQLALV